MAQFEGKVAVVTGGTQGLGAAIARLFADRGASGIVICGRSREKGEAKAREIQNATGAEVEFVAADLGQVEDCRAVIARADARAITARQSSSTRRRSRTAARSSTPRPSCSTGCSPSTSAARSF